jgi:hypothetical protein
MTPTARSGLLLVVAIAVATGVALLLRGDPSTTPGGTPGSGAARDVGAAVADMPKDSTAADAAAQERIAVATDKPAEVPSVRATGRLVDRVGRPVAGQELALQVNADPTMNDARVRLLGQERTAWQPHSVAVSAADGTFVLPLPVGALARLQPTGDECVFRQGPLEVEPLTVDAALGDIVVQPACVLAGVLRDLLGAPCRSVTVLCGADSRWFDENRASKLDTGDDGRFRFGGLANGSYKLLLRSPQYAAQTRTFELEPEQRLLDLVFTLDPGGTITGHVVDDAGAPVADVEVRANATRGNDPPSKSKSAADGSFTLGGLTGTAYNLSARGKGYRGDKSELAGVSPGARAVTVTLPRAAAIAGIVVDGSGAPVPGSRVRAVPASQPVEQDKQGWIFDPGTATGADGRFTLADLRGGTYRVLANGPHLDAAVSPVNAGPGSPVTDLQIKVQRGGGARIAVRDPDGRPVAHARVRVVDATAQDQRAMVLIGGGGNFDPDDFAPQRVARAETDAAGVAVVAGLQPGSYKAQVASAEFVQERPAQFQIAGAGEVNVDVALVTGGFALIEVVDGRGAHLPKKTVEVEGPLGAGKPQQTGGDSGSDGTVRLGPFLAGRYGAALGRNVSTDAFGGGVLVMSGGGPTHASSRVEFSVVAGETTKVKLQRPELLTLRGTLSDGRGPVANGRVQVGAETPNRSGDVQHGLDGSTRSARTRPDGSFSIADLEPGSYRVRFGKAKQELLAERAAVFASGGDVQLDLLLQCGNLRVTARGKKEPLAGAQATLRRADDDKAPKDRGIRDYAFPMAPTADLAIDAQGVAEFTDVPFGRYVVEVRATHCITGHSAVVSLDGASADAGTVELLPAGRITGRFIDPTGGSQYAYVEYRAATATEFSSSNGARDKFEVDGLAAGDYVLRARAMTNSGPSAPGPEVAVHLGDGDVATADLRLPAQ